VTFRVSLILILVGWIGLLISELRHGGVLSETAVLHSILLAGFQSVSARTAGFPGLPGFEQLRFDSILLLMMLMFIGSAPASTGGGITTGTFTVLWMGVVSYARGFRNIRIGNRSLPNTLIMRAAVVFIISLTVVLLGTWLILLTNDFSLSETLFEVVSAYSTTGLSLGITPGLNHFGLFVIIVTMFSGRLGAITIMIALIGREQRERLIEYPEESILVG
jgi:trk system potassium uptake protein TrkH